MAPTVTSGSRSSQSPIQGSPTNIFIVGRDSLGGSLLADALSRDGSIRAVTVHSADLLKAYAAQAPDIVVVNADINGVPGAGFKLMQSTFAVHPEAAFVVLMERPLGSLVIRAFRSGARGVFCTRGPMCDLIHCVEHVRQGFIWADKEATDSLLETFRNVPMPITVMDGDARDLTVRELQVVQCVASGKTNKAVAQELQLSEHTVKNYLFRAFEKLGVSSRVQLLYYLSTRSATMSMLKEEP